MKKTQKLYETITELIAQLQDLQSSLEINNEKAVKSPGAANIIHFPAVNLLTSPNDDEESLSFLERFLALPFLAPPEKPIPQNVPDFRPLLQRDGLILLAWDKRMTEMGERFTAYWVTSSGIPRFFASKPLSQKDFSSAWPDHKSYAAEDGIEFYGQAAPDYMVHVAPELMMSSSRHGELRQTHIKKLKKLGSKVNFNHKFLLTVEKNHNIAAGKRKNKSHRAGA